MNLRNQLPANDLAYLDENGKLRYRLDLVKSRLQKYIDNGYTHFTIGIENVPWAMAREKGMSGSYG